MFTEEVRVRLREFLAADPSMTLAELRAALGMSCSLPALHYVLKEMDLTFRGSSARRRARVAPAAEAERVELAASARGDETLADTNVAVATSPPKAKASKVSKASKAPSPGASAPVSAPGSRRKGGGKRV
ncbi:hypothetical protein DB346_20840 [Verrucomicrobia bacterium LW23]|nr:hypothetical protein DB346_20840 [Verrucomicrobia bacterium LW23]